MACTAETAVGGPLGPNSRFYACDTRQVSSDPMQVAAEFAHGRNLRKGRHSERGRIYLVTSCCQQRRKLFSASYLASTLCDQFPHQDKLDGRLTLAFVVMPDHFHWLVQLTSDVLLCEVVNSMKGRSARAINLARGSRESVWQAGFHDRALRNTDDLQVMANYLIHNPVRAGLVPVPQEYPYWWSAWHRKDKAPRD